MGMRMPETCWAVSKWQAINLWSCCILLVDSVEKIFDDFSPSVLNGPFTKIPQFIFGKRIVSALCVISLTLVLTSHMMPEVSVNRTKSCVHVSAMRTKTDVREKHDGRCFHCCSRPMKPGSELGWSSWDTILSVPYHHRSVIGSRDLWLMPCIE
jgi:hypothetical protein